MRIWLVENRSNGEASGLEAVLRRLVSEGNEGHDLVAVRPLAPSLANDLREHQIDALIVADRSWPNEVALPQLKELDIAVLVATSAEPGSWFGALGETHSVWFVPPRATLETLRLALKGLSACQMRRSHWKMEIARLQQRLNDRIVIERAKGILIRQLGISEEEAYQRLRVSSRRQRRQVRDIAQSLLDTEALFAPEPDGSLHSESEPIAGLQDSPA